MDNLDRKFQRAAKALNKVIAEYKKEYPKSFAYLDGSDQIHIMTGEREIGEIGDSDEIITYAELVCCGGDW